jgi:tetratricopeptide (TPR) repeat protein
MAVLGMLTWLMLLWAFPFFSQSPAVTPCDLIRSETQRQSGQKAFDNKQFAIAAKNFQEAYDACPGQHSILLQLSEADVRRREFALAIRATRQFLELEPGSIEGELVLAKAYFMAQRLPEALQEAENILKSQPAQPAALKLKGNIEYLSGHLEKALDAFIALLDRHPEDEEGAYMLGRIYYQEGRIDQAVGQFQRVLRITPKSYKAFDNLGLCYEALGDTEMATRYFLSAIKLVENDVPEYDWAYANLANLLLEKGDAGSAFAAAEKAADRNPYSARDFYLGGKALAALGKNDLSVNWLERSIALDPKYPEPLYLLARIYAQLGQQDKAKATLQSFRAVKAAAPRERK